MGCERCRKLPLSAALAMLALACALATALPARPFTPYISTTRFIDTERWLQDAKRGFDDGGILLQGGEYIPLSICFYGIMRYEEFLQGGDSAHYRAVVNQYQYFTRPGLTMSRFGGAGIGLPYHADFKDMRAPWFSGMAQGVAISYLLRYHDLTGDSSALDVARKVCFLMLMPEQMGGATSRRPNGDWWIEEYPRSLRSPYVMNGFINALIGLREYLDYFPGDRVAQAMHWACYRSLIRSFRDYDLPYTTCYNGKKQSVVPPSYMYYQVHEMEHLHALYRDPIFHYQHMIWAYMAMASVQNSTFLRHLYAPPMVMMTPAGQSDRWVVNWTRDGMLSEVKDFALEKSHDKPDTWDLWLPSATHFVQMEAPDGASIRPWQDGAERLGGYSAFGGGEYGFADALDHLVVHGLEAGQADSVRIFTLDPNGCRMPRYAMVNLGVLPVKKGEAYRVRAGGKVMHGTIFYRFAATGPQLLETQWRQEHRLPLADRTFIAPADGFYGAFVVLDMVFPHRSLRKVTVTPVAEGG